ncbi:MAG TPA: dienelactone hydrolase family protein [Mycobacteriales bacterium]|nr:dienelactone hydrolase family protein [Mycobacteriales bacterium]
MPNTTYPASVGTLRGYLATPDGTGPWPGVVVIHEAFGLTDDIRRQADRFAAEGYLAFAPDLYSYGFAPKCLVATMRVMFRGGGGRAVDDIEAARAFLVARDDCTGKVGVAGFCMGGAFAILAATRGFDAAAPNYGLVPKDAETALRGACATVGSYGAKDTGLRGSAQRLERALTNLGIDHDVKEYPNAGHGFMTEHTGNWWWAERIPMMGYVEDAADDAWSRMFAFFGKHLGGATGSGSDATPA